MGAIYALLVLSFIAIVLLNFGWAITNLYFFIIDGINTLVVGSTFIENIYLSTYLKWILLVDAVWIISALIFASTRKSYMTDPKLHYLSSNPISEPKLCVIIPTFNEEKNVERVVNDYKLQKFVQEIIVIDNKSTDRTVEIAKTCGVKVITKEQNKGFADSCILGMNESLKTDANVIVFTECDGTFSGSDLAKMLPYLDNCHMVIGTRQRQVLSEQKTQNSMFFVWGNYLLAKLIQIKYFSLLHLGVVELTDVGCMHRCIRKESLEKIIEKFVKKNTNEPVITPNSGLFAILMTMIGIENNLKIVEVPITFKRRIGISKTRSNKKPRAIQYGFTFFRFILSR